MSRQDNIEGLITRHERRLQKLKEKKAKMGINTPPEDLNEIEDIGAEVEQLRIELDELGKSGGNGGVSPKTPITTMSSVHQDRPKRTTFSQMDSSTDTLEEVQKNFNELLPVDFVIVTALEEERDAVLSKFPGFQQLSPSDDDIRVYYTSDLPVIFPNGSEGYYRIVVMSLLGMGRVHATLATTDAIRRWQPRYVLLVGIAGGIAAKDVNLGDILVSNQIVDYELQKLTPDGPQIRWDVHRANPRLVGAAQNLRDERWFRLVNTTRPPGKDTNRHIGPIASGDKVVAFGEVLSRYRDTWPALIGVEMEAAGVAAATFQAANPPGFFMVRCVSDLADEKKNKPRVKRWRMYACDAAASYTIALLQSGPVTISPGRNRAPNQQGLDPESDIPIELHYGTMPPDSKLYVERAADGECWNCLTSPNAVTLFIQASRQMGKSSLMQRMIHRAQKELNQPSVFIDFQEFPKHYFTDTTEEDFLTEFCLRVGEALGISEAIDQYWQQRGTNFFKCGVYLSKHIIPKLNKPFILAIDEVNRLLPSSISDDFFAMLRVWHNKRANDKRFQKMTLFLSSSAEASALINNDDQSPFNVAKQIFLAGFTREEAEELNKRHHSPLSLNQLDDLMDLIGGHPFLIRLALYQLATGRIDVDTLFAQATEDTGPFGDHLRDHLNLILRSPELEQAMTHIWRYRTYEENRNFHRLKGSGLIKRSDKQGVVPHNKLYDHYFAERLDI